MATHGSYHQKTEKNLTSRESGTIFKIEIEPIKLPLQSDLSPVDNISPSVQLFRALHREQLNPSYKKI